MSTTLLDIFFILYLFNCLVEARLNSNDFEKRPINSPSNYDINIFKNKHNILKDADISMQKISSSNSLTFHGKTYYLDDNHDHVKVFSDTATYMHNGVWGSLPPSHVSRKEYEDEIVTITKNRKQQTEAVTIINKGSRTSVQMRALANGVFATTQAEDYDYADINNKYHYGDNDEEIIRNRISHKVQTESITQYSPCTSYRELEVAIAYDSSFCSDLGSRSDADDRVSSLIAAVSEKYQQDGLCVKVIISHLEGHCDSSSDPYREFVSMNLSGCGNVGLLHMVKDYWMNFRTDVHRDTMLFFSGTGLECTDEDTCLIGCGYRGSLCRQDYGFAVNHVTFTDDINLQATLVAHELGHNCGAIHEEKSNFIMTAEINLGLNGFSDESVEKMNGVFSSTECLQEISDENSYPPSMVPSSASSSVPSSWPTTLYAPSTSPVSSPTVPSFILNYMFPVNPTPSAINFPEPSPVSSPTTMSPTALSSLSASPVVLFSDPSNIFERFSLCRLQRLLSSAPSSASSLSPSPTPSSIGNIVPVSNPAPSPIIPTFISEYIFPSNPTPVNNPPTMSPTISLYPTIPSSDRSSLFDKLSTCFQAYLRRST